MNRRRVASFFALSACLMLGLPRVATASPAEAGSGASSLETLLLRPADISHVYGGAYSLLTMTATSNKTVGSTASLTGLHSSDYVRAGRITGYVAIFAGGSGSFVNSIDMFKDTSGPKWELRISLTARPKLNGFGVTKQHVTSLGGVGDGALLATSSVKTPSSKQPTKVVEIVFRRGRYVGAVIIESSAQTKLSAAVKLASTMDARIRQHG